MLDERVKVLLEFGQALFAGERFVVAKEGQYHVSRIELQMVVRRAKVGRPQPQRQFIARETKIAHHQFMPRKTGLQQRLKPAEVLHPIG